MSGLRPFFSYYGSKWAAARGYPPPLYRQIVEPFAGSAGYALQYPDLEVLLVERDPVVARLWLWLITKATPTEVLALPDIPVDGHVDDFALRGPARDLVGFWIATAQVHPNRRPSSLRRRWPEKGWHIGMRRRIADQLHRIRHWRVICGDYTEAADLVHGPATWFVDPPYDNDAGDKYNGVKPDYAALATWTLQRAGQVIVCENEGATWLPFQPVWQTRSINRRSREAVYVRYDVAPQHSEVGA
jgi:hypothetical protein